MSFQADDVCIYCGEYYATHNSGNKCRKGKVGNLFAKEGSITLNKLSPGTCVRLYCDNDHNLIYHTKSEHHLGATIMNPYPTKGDYILLGWKDGEIRDNSAWIGKDDDNNLKLDAGFQYGWWVMSACPVKRIVSTPDVVATMTTPPVAGLTCSSRFCKTFVFMAEANQPDGTFVCYSCRNRPSYMR
jgi:hypothetical protein